MPEKIPQQPQLSAADRSAAPAPSPAMARLLKIIQSGAPRTAQRLLRDEGDGLAREVFRSTPLIEAAAFNRLDMVLLFLPLCDPQAVNNMGDSALHCAADHGNLAAIDLLLPVSDADAKGYFESTPLINAVLRGHLDIVKRLLPRSDLCATIDRRVGDRPPSSALACAAQALIRGSADARSNRQKIHSLIEKELLSRAERGDAAACATLGDCAREIARDFFGPLPQMDLGLLDRAAQILLPLVPFSSGPELLPVANNARFPAALRGPLKGAVESKILADEIALPQSPGLAAESNSAPAPRRRRILKA